MSETHPFHHLLPLKMRDLRQFAQRLTGNPHRADDLVQATMLKAWANRDSYKPGTNLRAWLFTILRNAFYSDLRKYRREVEDIDGLRAGALAQEPCQDHVLSLNELIAALGNLPERQRKPLVLMGAYGFSQLEASSACGCSVGTIKSRVSRGRTTLSAVLNYDVAIEDREMSVKARSEGRHVQHCA